MAITSGSIIQVLLDYVYPGAGTALNIFYWVYGGADKDEVDLLDELALWADGEWGELWDEIASDQATLNNVQANEVAEDGTLIRPLGASNIGRVGTEASNVLPAANSAYMQAYTDIPRVFGKKYVPGIAESTVDSGELNAAAIAQLIALTLQYVQPHVMGTGGTLFPGVLSSKTGGFEQFNETAIIDSLPAYQRRRKDGVGS